MKKLLHYFIFTGVLFFLIPSLFAQTSTPPSGAGTSESPYLVGSLENLYWISLNSQHWDKYYVQTENIDASATQFWNNGDGWEPIGNSDTKFTGNYDGGGNIIKNLYINRPEAEDYPVNWFQALFGYIEDATITNLGVIDADITGFYYVGALVGRNDNSSINKCFTSGVITGEWQIGGLSGGSFVDSEIEKCYSIGTIDGVRNVGGLVGYNNANLKNSYSNASVIGSWNSAGLVGINHEFGSINDCYSTGYVNDGNDDYGGLVGKNMDGGLVNRSYWNTETSEQATSQGGEGKTTEEMLSSGTFTGWDFVDVWDIIEDETYPFLQWQEGPSSHNYPYKNELKLFANPEEGGTPSGAGFYEENQVVEISANPNDGYFFVNWTGNTFYVDDPDAESTNVDMPDFDISLTANYSPITLTIEIEPVGAGNVSIDPDQEIYHEGDVVTLTAQPDLNQGYLIDNWSIGETVLSYEDELEYTMPGTSVTIKANFKDAFAGGEGTEHEPWLIETPEHLNNIRYYLGIDNSNKHFKQIANINLDVEPYNEGEGWIPIGMPDFFSGTYDGGVEYEITGLFINRPESNGQGLFGYINEAKIINVTLIGADITAQNNTGALVGQQFSSTIDNCSSSGTVTGNDDVGGLVGYMFENNIINSHSSCVVSGMNNRAGGLAGGVYGTSIIDNSYSTGNIEGGSNTGGLVGEASGGSTIKNSYSNGDVSGSNISTGGLVGRNYGTVENSFSSGNVSSTNNYVGGLVGYNHDGSVIRESFSTSDVTGTGSMWFGGLAGIITDSEIENSYSTGNVTGNERTGGLVGQISNSSITNCYSTGSVEGTSDTGGLVGYYMSGTIENSFWNTETSGQQTSAAGEGKTTMEMITADTFNEWDFINTWGIIEDETYPFLQWQDDPGEHNYPELYTLTIIINPEGSGSVEGDGSRPAGGLVELVATVNEGVVFINWTDQEDNEISSEGSFLYQMPAKDVTIYANFDERFAGGFGTENQPWLIETTEHLNNIRLHTFHNPDDYDVINNADRIYFKQTADIDLDIAPWNEGEGWEPIGFEDYRFVRATYIGDGFVIENLYINRPESDNIGLFGFLNGYNFGGGSWDEFKAHIEGVNLVNADITGANNTGILAGTNDGIIYDCSSSGIVRGKDHVGGLTGSIGSGSIVEGSYSSAECNSSGNYAGGLIGRFLGTCSIKESYSTGNVIGNWNVGGLIGGALFTDPNTEIYNCYSTSSVSGNSYIGGLIGRSDEEHVLNCYSTGRVIGENNTGGLIGHINNLPENIENSYWNTETSGIESSAGGEGKSTEEMTSQNTFNNWDFVDIWSIIEDITFPYLQWQTDINHNAPPEFFELSLLTNPENAGTTEGEGEYPEKSLVEVIATPNDGYYLDNWTDQDNNVVGEDDIIYYTMPSDNTTLTANFAPVDYEIHITINPEGKGSVEFDPEQDYYNVGDAVTLTAISVEGYEFDSWGGTFQGDDPVLNFTMPADDVYIYVYFQLGYYTINLNSNPQDGGWTGRDPWQTNYNFGDIVTITAYAYDNYEFTNWTDEDDNVISNQESHDYAMPTHDVVLTANFDFVESVKELAEAGIKVFPNPASNKLTIESPEVINHIKLIDITGQVTKHLIIDDFQTKLNVNNLKTGIYFLQIHTEEAVITKRVQIAR